MVPVDPACLTSCKSDTADTADTECDCVNRLLSFHIDLDRDVLGMSHTMSGTDQAQEACFLKGGYNHWTGLDWTGRI